MAVGVPGWGPLTMFYDSAGQEPSIVREIAPDGRAVNFLLDRLTISLSSGADEPFANAVGLSGTLSVSLPEDLNLAGLLLVVNGHIGRTGGTQAVLGCSLGHGTNAIQWPLLSAAGAPTPDPVRPGSQPAAEQPAAGERPDDAIAEISDFRVECFTGDVNPAMIGVPPFAPFPPLPLTLSMHARRRAADEEIDFTVTDFRVIILSS
jgi:hypothetical protein